MGELAMEIVDSHTGGEPTRVVLSGGPDLGSGSMVERKRRFTRDFEEYRRRIILEPRAPEAMVGILLCEPDDPANIAGAIFFNTVGTLDMCGHGLIGLMVTLGWLGRIAPGKHTIETPAGVVTAALLTPDTVAFDNVPSYCLHRNITVAVPGYGDVTGSVAWGGNWFFLVDRAPVPVCPGNIAELTAAGTAIRRALAGQGITGAEGAEVDHIEFFDTPAAGDDAADSRNFVLCPGLAYDRSPCGTGTSAKIACLAEAGTLAEGETWVQESMIGSRFRASYRRDDKGRVIPRIEGQAHIMGEGRLVFQPGDPFADGIAF